MDDLLSGQEYLQSAQKAAKDIENNQLELAQIFVNQLKEMPLFAGLFNRTFAALQIQRTLAGVARGLRRAMSLETKRSGSGVVKITVDYNTSVKITDATATWHSGSKVDLFLLTLTSSEKFGEFNCLDAEPVTRALISGIINGYAVIPEFTLVAQESVNKYEVELIWKRKTLDDIIDAVS